MCLPCEPGPPSPRRPQPGSISPPPHAPMRRRLCFCAGLNPSLAGGYFCGFGGDPKRRPRASFSLCQERDTLSRVGMASGRCRFLPHPLTGTDWSEGGGGPRLSQQTGASALCRLFGLHSTNLGHHHAEVVRRFNVKIFNRLGPRRSFVVWRNDAATLS